MIYTYCKNRLYQCRVNFYQPRQLRNIELLMIVKKPNPKDFANKSFKPNKRAQLKHINQPSAQVTVM